MALIQSGLSSIFVRQLLVEQTSIESQICFRTSASGRELNHDQLLPPNPKNGCLPDYAASSRFRPEQLIHVVLQAPPILRPRLIVRFIPLPRLPTHPTRRVVIKRNRPPSDAFRRSQRLRMPVIAILIRIKNHTPVINR